MTHGKSEQIADTTFNAASAANDPVAISGGDSAPSVLVPKCASRVLLRRLVDRWAPLIVIVLSSGPLRFNALRDTVGGVSPKVLTQTLRAME